MNIIVTVIDGMSGLPAEGLKVAVIAGATGDQTCRLSALTGEQGNFTYSSGAERLSNGEHYTLELDVDAYFASLGIVAGYKKIAMLARVVSTEQDYRIGALITPFAHTIWSFR